MITEGGNCEFLIVLKNALTTPTICLDSHAGYNSLCDESGSLTVVLSGCRASKKNGAKKGGH